MRELCWQIASIFECFAQQLKGRVLAKNSSRHRFAHRRRNAGRHEFM